MRMSSRAYKYLCAFLCLLSVSCAKSAIDSVPAQTSMQGKPLNITDVKSLLPEEKATSWTVNNSLNVAREVGALEHLFFLHNTHGWVASKSAVVKTTDGGRSWETVKLNTPAQAEIMDINFVNTSLGWLVIEKQVPDSNYRENHFWAFQTQDGGQTWRLN